MQRDRQRPETDMAPDQELFRAPRPHPPRRRLLRGERGGQRVFLPFLRQGAVVEPGPRSYGVLAWREL